jgi:hypothetical protein
MAVPRVHDGYSDCKVAITVLFRAMPPSACKQLSLTSTAEHGMPGRRSAPPKLLAMLEAVNIPRRQEYSGKMLLLLLL